MGFLENSKYPINGLSSWNFDNLLEIKFLEFLIRFSFLLPDESLSKCHDIIDIIWGFGIDRDTSMTGTEEKSTEFQNGHLLGNKVH
jgi:hypothetical protein